MTPDGKFVLVAVYETDSVAFIDTASRKVVGTCRWENRTTSRFIRTAPSPTSVHRPPGMFSLVIIDLQRRTVKENVPLEKTPRGLEFGPNRKIFVHNRGGSRFPDRS